LENLVKITAGRSQDRTIFNLHCSIWYP
jgi:hypothetical protein